VLDQQWKEHLLNMDHLREGIGLRGYAQHDPLVEYKRESFDMFEAMMDRFQEETVRYLYLMQVIGGNQQGTGGQPQGEDPGQQGGNGNGNGNRPPQPGGDGTRPRGQQTSVDDLEEEFLRKKKRELQQARMAGGGESGPVQQVVRAAAKVGRNDPCPCGSGKKYKKCCGQNA
jgi:preprotein translocase subunit SecA